MDKPDWSKTTTAFPLDGSPYTIKLHPTPGGEEVEGKGYVANFAIVLWAKREDPYIFEVGSLTGFRIPVKMLDTSKGQAAVIELAAGWLATPIQKWNASKLKQALTAVHCNWLSDPDRVAAFTAAAKATADGLRQGGGVAA